MNIELAKRLCAHDRWEWRDGMLVCTLSSWERLVSVDASQDYCDEYAMTHVSEALFVDLDDHATQGVLLGMLREATDRPKNSLGYMSTTFQHESFAKRHQVEVWDGEDATEENYYQSDESFGEALALALLAQWGEG